MGSGGVGARVINITLVVVIALIGLRALFVLFDGNPRNEIVGFVNAVTGVLLAPFEGMFRRQSELITALVGALAYSVLAGVALAVEQRVTAGRSADDAPPAS